MNLDLIKYLFYSVILILTFGSCDDEETQDLSHCTEELTACSGYQDGSYCLYGVKWGEDPLFENPGIDVTGPQSSGGTITYGFLTESINISTTMDSDLKTVPFDDKGECARDQARAALAEWEKHGNFTFEEVEDNLPCDIQFIAADGVLAALGNPNYNQLSCNALKGKIFFSGSQIPCEIIYTLSLHEVGHALGLGHVSDPTIMGTGASQGIDSLQPGDIEGIQAIYGPK